MEKTMEYALNEALETGRRSAMPVFLEKELREKIAQDIEAMICDPFNCPKYYPEVNIDECVRVAILLEQVARVARGTSNE